MVQWRPNVPSLFPVLTLFLIILLGGCATGAAEFQLYIQGFDDQYEQGQIVLDRVARAERIVVRRRLARTSASGFNPDDAAYYLDTGDPPITASIRASLKSLKDYNHALGALANGERVRGARRSGRDADGGTCRHSHSAWHGGRRNRACARGGSPRRAGDRRRQPGASDRPASREPMRAAARSASSSSKRIPPCANLCSRCATAHRQCTNS